MEDKIKNYVEFEKKINNFEATTLKNRQKYNIYQVFIDEINFKVTTKKSTCIFNTDFGKAIFKKIKYIELPICIIPRKKVDSNNIEFIEISDYWEDLYYLNPLNVFCVSKYFFNEQNGKIILNFREGEFRTTEIDIFCSKIESTEFIPFKRNLSIYSNNFTFLIDQRINKYLDEIEKDEINIENVFTNNFLENEF